MRNFDPVGAEAMTKQFPMKPTLPSTTGRAILNRRPSYVPDVRDDPAYVGTPLGEAARIAGFVSIVAVPMLREGQPIGTINAAAGQPDAFSETQIALLQTFADQAVIAIENVLLFTELQEKNRALTALVEIRELKDRLQRENIVLREEIDKTSMFDEIVGSSPPLNTVLSQVSKVAPTDSTVLITGETGTGKELVARAIHKQSRRASRTFVGVNCAAIPASLIASELFGHEKGAFTGAVQRRQGRFELADGGTIFLDEVGELPTETQIMLLRVLQEREFERVGGTGPLIVEFATKQRLPTMIGLRADVEAGGLLSYSPSAADVFRRAAYYVDRILKGAKPGDLPIERPTKFELVINMKTAKSLGLTIPQSLLLRADQVIE